MALPSSGPLGIGAIRTELGTSDGSLRYLSGLAGFSSPDSISEFYGYSNSIDVSFFLGITSTNFYRDTFRLYPSFASPYSTDTYLYVAIEYTVYNNDFGPYQDGRGFTFGPFSSGISPRVFPPIDTDVEYIQSIDIVFTYYFTFGTGSDLNITAFNY